MVCSVGSVEDFALESSCLESWESDFILRKQYAEKMLFQPDYFLKYSKSLPKQLEMVECLAGEATELHEQYMRFNPNGRSNPNYENMMLIYDGVRARIRNMIRDRQEQDS